MEDQAKGKSAADIHGAIDKAADTVTTRAHQGVDWLGATAEKVKKQHRNLSEQGSAEVRSKPLVYVGAALALGFLIGKLL